jgi:dolichol kinase
MNKFPHHLADLPHLEPVAPSIWPRRLFHFLAGSLVPLCILFLPEALVEWLLIVGIIIAVGIEVGRAFLPDLNAVVIAKLPIFKDAERDVVTGGTFLVISAAIAYFAFDKEIVVLALFFLSVGDPLAALIGRWDPKFRVFGKSLIGTAAFATGAIAAGLIVSLHPDIPWAWWIIPGAIIAAIMEILPFPFDDNISIPLATAGAMTLLAMA